MRIDFQPPGTGFTNTVGIFKGRNGTTLFERAHMRDGIVLNDDWSTSAIVHQYDRILRSSGPDGIFGRSPDLLRLAAIDSALNERRNSGAWLALGA